MSLQLICSSGIGVSLVIGYLQSTTGAQKKVRVGFSWTTLVFGFLGPLIRGDIKWAGILFLSEMAINFFSGEFFLTLVAQIVLSFMYNKIYIQGPIKKGYIPYGDNFANKLRQKGISFTEHFSDSIESNSHSNMSIF